jgi:hypothetical protein
MATVLNMPDVLTEAESRKKLATKYFEKLKKAGGLSSTSSLQIGWNAHAILKDNLFQMLGFENERDVREAAEISDSGWYSNLRIAEAFDGLEEETFYSLKQANARELAKLPQSKRLSPEWITKAKKDPIKSFALQIEEELDGKATSENGKESIVSYAVKMPKSRRKAVQEGLLEISKGLGCEGDESRTIELIVAERRGAVSLVETITNAAQRCGRIKELAESGLSSDEVLAQVIVLNEESILEFATALQNLESE